MHASARRPVMLLLASLLVLVGCSSTDEQTAATADTSAASTPSAPASTSAEPGASASPSAAASQGGDDDLLAGIEQAMQDAGSAKVDITVSVSGMPGSSEPLTIRTTGVSSTRTKEASLTSTTSGTPAEVQAQPGPIEQEIRVVDGVTYLRSPALPAPTPWVEVPAGQENALGMSGTDALGGSAMAQFASGEVEKVGTEQIGGVETTHYRFDVDLAASSQQQGASGMAQQLRQLGVDTAPFDLWLDDENRVRRTEVTMPIPGIAPTGGEPDDEPSVSMRAEYSDFGAEVSVEAPPQDQVTPLSELQVGELQASASPAPSPSGG